MKSPNPLIFPDTSINTAQTLLLLIFFKKLYHYLPIPPDEKPVGQLHDKGLFEGYTPVSLENDLDRFKLLLKDLKGHENEYLGGYISSLSGFSPDVDEAAVWTIFKKLSAGNTNTSDDSRQREILWQALLLLKLSETLLQEEEIIAAGLSAVHENHAKLLEALKGGDEDEDDDLFSAGVSSETTPAEFAINYEKLTKAWAHLFVRDPRRDNIWLLATLHRESAFLVMDCYESLSGAPAQNVATIDLPGANDNTAEADLKNVLSLQASVSDSLNGFYDLIWEVATAGDETALKNAMESISQAEKKCQELITQGNTKLTLDRRLRFYLFKDFSLQQLFAKLNGSSMATARTFQPVARHGILAVLSRE